MTRGDSPDNYVTDVLRATSVPICPECAAGKHGNCADQALDPITDDFVPCGCLACSRPEIPDGAA